MYKKEWEINNFESEDQFQVACVLMISQEFPRIRDLFWHTKNEVYIEKNKDESKEEYEKRCLIIRGKFKAMGLKAGVMDILFLLNGILYKIELKQPGKKLSDKQEEFHSFCLKDCPQIKPIVCYTVADVYNYITKVIKLNYKISFYDYRELLIKYIRHVKSINGSSFIESINYENELSKDDLEKLKSLE